MITYELLMLLRIMTKPELTSTLKRTASLIYNKGGIIRKLENLGTRQLPYKISSNGLVHREGSYFLMEFNVPPSCLQDIKDEYGRDVDFIRRKIFKKNEEDNFSCTLQEELQPPPYRKDVQELVEKARKLDKPKFEYKTGLEYYPFQK